MNEEMNNVQERKKNRIITILMVVIILLILALIIIVVVKKSDSKLNEPSSPNTPVVDETDKPNNDKENNNDILAKYPGYKEDSLEPLPFETGLLKKEWDEVGLLQNDGPFSGFDKYGIKLTHSNGKLYFTVDNSNEKIYIKIDNVKYAFTRTRDCSGEHEIVLLTESGDVYSHYSDLREKLSADSSNVEKILKEYVDSNPFVKINKNMKYDSIGLGGLVGTYNCSDGTDIIGYVADEDKWYFVETEESTEQVSKYSKYKLDYPYNFRTLSDGTICDKDNNKNYDIKWLRTFAYMDMHPSSASYIISEDKKLYKLGYGQNDNSYIELVKDVKIKHVLYNQEMDDFSDAYYSSDLAKYDAIIVFEDNSVIKASELNFK